MVSWLKQVPDSFTSRTIIPCESYLNAMPRINKLYLLQSLSACSRVFFLVFGYVFFFSGCTATKFLKEGETFYSGAEIILKPQGKIGRKRELRNELETFIIPEPNKTFFGMRPAVWFYYAAGTPKKKKGLRNFIKNKLGTPPVLLKDATP